LTAKGRLKRVPEDPAELMPVFGVPLRMGTCMAVTGGVLGATQRKCDYGLAGFTQPFNRMERTAQEVGIRYRVPDLGMGIGMPLPLRTFTAEARGQTDDASPASGRGLADHGGLEEGHRDL